MINLQGIFRVDVLAHTTYISRPSTSAIDQDKGKAIVCDFHLLERQCWSSAPTTGGGGKGNWGIFREVGSSSESGGAGSSREQWSSGARRRGDGGPQREKNDQYVPVGQRLAGEFRSDFS
ncbi:hypothetical protein Scep_006940 [Stephania cephalantha]|uniref:Uncharacterized protein n=1 Tax=Stephania cephalantha TaxID=152367 RepID=A0AAP0K8T6_9MAGN